MRHPAEGVLRRLLDEPAAVPDADRRHVAACEQCLDGLAAARDDAALLDAALLDAALLDAALLDTSPDDPALDAAFVNAAPVRAAFDASSVDADRGATRGTPAEVDVSAAWRRLTSAQRVPKPVGSAHPPRPGRSRALLRRPVIAALVVAVVLAGAGTAAASGWLQIFRTEQIAPVGFTAADLLALPDLSAYGDVVLRGEADLHGVDGPAAAAAETGLDVPETIALPRGVSGEPEYQVGGEVSAVFTFSTERATRAAAAAGETLPPAPAGLDGTQLRLVAGPGWAGIWSQPAGIPALVVGRAVAPSAFSSGVPYETVRDYLLAVPGLPDEVAAQLRTFTADGSTLPLPVPADLVTSSSAEVNGVPATVLTSRDQTMAAVVWVADGVLTVVAGALAEAEVLSVAGSLR